MKISVIVKRVLHGSFYGAWKNKINCGILANLHSENVFTDAGT